MYQADQTVFARLATAAILTVLTVASINHLFSTAPQVEAAQIAAQTATLPASTGANHTA